MFLFIALWAFESYTDMMRLGRMDRCVSLLQELAALESSGALAGDTTLQEIHSELTIQLQAVVLQSKARTTLSPMLFKILAAAAPWFLTMLLFVRRSTRGDRGIALTVVSFAILALPFVIIGAVLPLYPQRWVNYALYPWGSYVAFLVLALIIQSIKKKRTN